MAKSKALATLDSTNVDNLSSSIGHSLYVLCPGKFASKDVRSGSRMPRADDKLLGFGDGAIRQFIDRAGIELSKTHVLVYVQEGRKDEIIDAFKRGGLDTDTDLQYISMDEEASSKTGMLNETAARADIKDPATKKYLETLLSSPAAEHLNAPYEGLMLIDLARPGVTQKVKDMYFFTSLTSAHQAVLDQMDFQKEQIGRWLEDGHTKLPASGSGAVSDPQKRLLHAMAEDMAGQAAIMLGREHPLSAEFITFTERLKALFPGMNIKPHDGSKTGTFFGTLFIYGMYSGVGPDYSGDHLKLLSDEKRAELRQDCYDTAIDWFEHELGIKRADRGGAGRGVAPQLAGPQRFIGTRTGKDTGIV